MTNLAQWLRERTRTLLADYDRREGISADHYWKSPQWHAMAEGKFLSTLAEARRLKLLSASECKAMCERSCARLRLGNLADNPKHACWGLGFPYKDTDAREPFLITTAIVVRGLIEQDKHSDTELLHRSLTWLESYPWLLPDRYGARRIKLPAFSPHVQLVVTNAVSYSSGVMAMARNRLSKAGRKAVDRNARWALSRYQAPIGWPYSRESSRFDLLHQCYILEGLAMWREASGATLDKLEEIALETISGFQLSNQWIDKLDVVSREAAIDACSKSANYSMASAGGDNWILRHHVEARPWSYGELLVVMSRFAEHGKFADHWCTMARRVGMLLSQRVMNPDKAADNHRPGYTAHDRDLMHIGHGLVRLLAVLRGQAADRNETDIAEKAVSRSSN